MKTAIGWMLVWTISLAAAEEKALDAALEKKIARWVAQLGDPDYQQREQATEALDQIGYPAVTAVRQAAASKDAEIAVRAKRLLKIWRGYMGVSLTTAPTSGAQVVAVLEGLPAQKAGLEAGDIILKLDGDAVLSTSDLIARVKENFAGAKIKLMVLRDDKEKEIVVELARRPEELDGE